jgi:3'-5' exonuclease
MSEYLYLDIETIGAPTPEMVEEITASITVPGSYKKPETIAEWEQNTKPGLVKEALAKTALTGLAGQVICIGWAWGDNEADAVMDSRGEQATIDSALASISKQRPGGYERPVIVGHNVAGFDIRFLWQRAFVLGVKMPAWFPRDPKPWADSVHDTMTMWGGRDWVGLDTLCKAMGLPGKGNVSGADIGGMWERGEHEAIGAYCKADVERVRAVHRKMLVAYGEAA